MIYRSAATTLILSMLAGAGVLWIGIELGRRSAERSSTREISTVLGDGLREARHPPMTARRLRLQEAIDKIPVSNAAGLDDYLKSLEVSSRQRGEVTAFEIEPGLAAIRRFGSDPEKLFTFTQRMLALQSELQGEKANAPTHSVRTVADQ
jgi:hypothetical protein